jgi:hypothetical protein
VAGVRSLDRVQVWGIRTLLPATVLVWLIVMACPCLDVYRSLLGFPVYIRNELPDAERLMAALDWTADAAG